MKEIKAELRITASIMDVSFIIMYSTIQIYFSNKKKFEGKKEKKILLNPKKKILY